MEQTLLSDLSPIIVHPFHSSADTIFVQNFIYTIYIQPKKTVLSSNYEHFGRNRLLTSFVFVDLISVRKFSSENGIFLPFLACYTFALAFSFLAIVCSFITSTFVMSNIRRTIWQKKLKRKQETRTRCTMCDCACPG